MTLINNRVWQQAEFEAIIHDKKLNNPISAASKEFSEKDDKQLTKAMEQAVARKRSGG